MFMIRFVVSTQGQGDVVMVQVLAWSVTFTLVIIATTSCSVSADHSHGRRHSLVVIIEKEI